MYSIPFMQARTNPAVYPSAQISQQIPMPPIHVQFSTTSQRQRIMSLNFAKNIGFRARFLIVQLLRLVASSIGLLALSSVIHAEPYVAATNPQNDQIMVFNRSWSPLLESYQDDVIRTILDASVASYGSYSLAHYPVGTSATRALQISKERGVHFAEISTSALENQEANQGLIQLPYPFFDGLLGLRKLVVRNIKYQDFANITSPETFLKFSAGQRSNWPDINTYRYSGVRVVEGQNFTSMFAMLSASRFDYLPLSILEADDSLSHQAAEAKQTTDLTLHDKLYIYYPMPVYLKVHEAQAPRFIEGLHAAKQSGALTKLFDEYFRSSIAALPSENSTVVLIANPALSADQNNNMMAQTLNRYLGSKNTLISLKSDLLSVTPAFAELSRR